MSDRPIPKPPQSDRVFKIVDASEWAAAEQSGAFAGSRDDLRDGFVHLSTATQVAGTLERHFRGRANLLIIAYAADDLGPLLKWEISRNGEYFPHLYGTLPVARAAWQRRCDGCSPDQLTVEPDTEC